MRATVTPIQQTLAPSAPAAARLAPAQRLLSLDVFRGLTVAAMILVTDPGTYSAVYPQLLHAAWNGTTATDMIFPSFLFIAGMAIALSTESRLRRGESRAALVRHTLRRSAVIFAIGLLVNGFPDYNLHTLRIPGVLQRIALCYLAGGLLYLRIERKSARQKITILASLTTALLVVYWALLKLAPVPGFGAGRLDSLGNLAAYLDRLILGTRHMWVWGLTPAHGVTYDPEGLLSTLPAIATLLIGMLAAEWMRGLHSARIKVLALAAASVALMLAGKLLDPWMPINKRLWTGTFVLWSGGVSLLAFSACYALLDWRRWRWWTLPALIFGANALTAFALSNVITTLLDRVHAPVSGQFTLHQWGYQTILALGLRPVNASLAYAIAIVLLNLALLLPLYRKRVFLRA
jgi:predicted acyltransferase